MIQDPIQTRRALLTWLRPLTDSGARERFAVGELTQCGDQVEFAYLDDGVERAREHGFTGYPGLPLKEDVSLRAMPLLMHRLPPVEREDFGEYLERFGMRVSDGYSGLSLLAYTGARLSGDSFGVAETFDGFDRPFAYLFDVSGYRHYRNNNLDLEVGETLLLECEPSNKEDPNAVRILRTNQQTVGYINRHQTGPVRQWLAEGRINASVFRINGRQAYPRLFVHASIDPRIEAYVSSGEAA